MIKSGAASAKASPSPPLLQLQCSPQEKGWGRWDGESDCQAGTSHGPGSSAEPGALGPVIAVSIVESKP